MAAMPGESPPPRVAVARPLGRRVLYPKPVLLQPLFPSTPFRRPRRPAFLLVVVEVVVVWCVVDAIVVVLWCGAQW